LASDPSHAALKGAKSLEGALQLKYQKFYQAQSQEFAVGCD